VSLFWQVVLIVAHFGVTRGARRRAGALEGRDPSRRSPGRDQGNGAGLQSRRADSGAGVEGRRRRYGGGGDLEKAPDACGRRDKRFPAEVRENRSSIRSPHQAEIGGSFYHQALPTGRPKGAVNPTKEEQSVFTTNMLLSLCPA